MEKKLEVKDLQISFRTMNGNVKAVRNITFDLYKGETLAIVGESGSGKSVTSKAIIGILAGNSIVEGGQILYDGQDLLKISEEDFHKIRGDRISMIFQDPMSSLNPIMKVGKQITEAMILKAKSSSKNARINFNNKLEILRECIDEVNAIDNLEQKKINHEKCKTFDDFCIVASKLELNYNHARSALLKLELEINRFLFLIEKKQKIDLKKSLRKISFDLHKAYDPFLLVRNQKMVILQDNLLLLNKKIISIEEAEQLLLDVKEQVKIALRKEKPNFFRLGYYMLKNPTADVSYIEVEELNRITRKYLDENFMFDFIELGSLGILQSHNKSIKNKQEILPELDKAIAYFRNENIEYSESMKICSNLSKRVKQSIDYLETIKSSKEYSFNDSLKSLIDYYFDGLFNNPKALKKYNLQQSKYDSLVKKGKKPTYKVIPPRTVDLALAKKNIVQLIYTLKEHYIKVLNNHSFDANKRMIDLIDYLKEQATLVVYNVSRSMAKARAIELLEEVGIKDPEARYNQYPFEFSGGMRQRIVIAIALAANPDILICDEPTTALDVTIQSQILELINKIKEERKLSVIFITHDLGVVANMADRIAVMYAGKIVETGTCDDIFYDPRHPYTWALLSSMPDLDTKEKLEAIPGTPPNMIYPPKGDAFAERNKYALEIDFKMQPPMFEVTPTHYAATWLLHPYAPKVSPPKIVTSRIERMKKEMAKHEG